MLKGIQRGNQGAMRRVGLGWRGSAARFLHKSTRRDGTSAALLLFPARLWPISPTCQISKVHTAEVFYILCFATSHFANQIQPVCINRFGYSVWFLLSLLGVSSGLGRKKKGELICLLRLSKHLWDADKNTQEANAPRDDETTYSPVGPRIKSHLDCVSRKLLRSASLSSSSAVSVSPFLFLLFFFFFFSIQSLQSWKRKQLHFLLANYRAFAVNCFY